MDEPVGMIAFLMRTVTRLETELATVKERNRELVAFLEGLREGYQEQGLDAEKFFQVMDGDCKPGP